MADKGLWGIRAHAADKILAAGRGEPCALGRDFVEACRDLGPHGLYRVHGAMVDATGERFLTPAAPDARELARRASHPFRYADAAGGLLDSVAYSFAYIANLDSGLLEFRRGYQGFPDPANRYGTDELDGFYPLRTLAVYPLDALSDPDAIVADMRRTCDAEAARHPRLGLLPPHIFAP